VGGAPRQPRGSVNAKIKTSPKTTTPFHQRDVQIQEIPNKDKILAVKEAPRELLEGGRGNSAKKN